MRKSVLLLSSVAALAVCFDGFAAGGGKMYDGFVEHVHSLVAKKAMVLSPEFLKVIEDKSGRLHKHAAFDKAYDDADDAKKSLSSLVAKKFAGEVENLAAVLIGYQVSNPAGADSAPVPHTSGAKKEKGDEALEDGDGEEETGVSHTTGSGDDEVAVLERKLEIAKAKKANKAKKKGAKAVAADGATEAALQKDVNEAVGKGDLVAASIAYGKLNALRAGSAGTEGQDGVNSLLQRIAGFRTQWEAFRTRILDGFRDLETQVAAFVPARNANPVLLALRDAGAAMQEVLNPVPATVGVGGAGADAGVGHRALGNDGGRRPGGPGGAGGERREEAYDADYARWMLDVGGRGAGGAGADAGVGHRALGNDGGRRPGGPGGAGGGGRRPGDGGAGDDGRRPGDGGAGADLGVIVAGH